MLSKSPRKSTSEVPGWSGPALSSTRLGISCHERSRAPQQVTIPGSSMDAKSVGAPHACQTLRVLSYATVETCPRWHALSASHRCRQARRPCGCARNGLVLSFQPWAQRRHGYTARSGQLMAQSPVLVCWWLYCVGAVRKHPATSSAVKPRSWPLPKSAPKQPLGGAPMRQTLSAQAGISFFRTAHARQCLKAEARTEFRYLKATMGDTCRT